MLSVGALVVKCAMLAVLAGPGGAKAVLRFRGKGALVFKVTGGRGYRGELVQVEGGNC